MTHVTDSGYSRLSSAWIGARGALLGLRVARTRSDTHDRGDFVYENPVDLSHAPRIVVARQLLPLPDAFHCGLLESNAYADQIYRIDPVRATSLGDVWSRCNTDAPRLLLMDLALLRNAGAGEAEHLRAQLPATDWVLMGNGPIQPADVARCAWVRGCIDWATDSLTLTKALDVTMAGHLWFPRVLVENLYLALLGRHAPEASASSPVATPATGSHLTTRESDVLALLRHGMTNKQIAERLDISVNTVKKHLAHVFEKRGLHSRRQTVE